MHFALPPRKTSLPPLYARAAARSLQNRRKSQAQATGLVLLSIVIIWVLLRAWISSSGRHGGSIREDGYTDEDFKIVIVTVLDKGSMSEDYMRKIRTNRDDYAARHGYTTFYTNTSTYSHLLSPAPKSWSLVPALRHALTLHPSSTHIFSLSPHALITSPSIPLESHVLAPTNLSTLTQKDIPVVPPDSVIHTFSHLDPPHTHLILSQDIGNLAHTSLILRNSAWSRYFLDVWFDPLYRAYMFQKAEGHALEHIVQWHPTILAKLVLVPQRRINSYNFAMGPEKDPDTGQMIHHDSLWQSGDLLVNFKGCDHSKQRNCEEEMAEYWSKWVDEVEGLGGVKTARESS